MPSEKGSISRNKKPQQSDQTPRSDSTMVGQKKETAGSTENKKASHQTNLSPTIPLPKSIIISKENLPTTIDPANPPMGTSSLIGTYKTVIPKRTPGFKQQKKTQTDTGGVVRGEVESTAKAALPLTNNSSAAIESFATVTSELNLTPGEGPDPLLEASLIPEHLFHSPPMIFTPPEQSAIMFNPLSPVALEHSLNMVSRNSPPVPTSKTTPSSQPRSIRKSSRRTATSSSQLDKAKRLFQDAEEIFSPPPNLSRAGSTADQPRQIKDFELDYESTDSTEGPVKPEQESRTQQLAKQRRGQVLGNSMLTQDAMSNLPLKPSSLPRIGTERTPPTQREASNSGSLSALTPAFVPHPSTQNLSGAKRDSEECYSNLTNGPIDQASKASTNSAIQIDGLPNQNLSKLKKVDFNINLDQNSSYIGEADRYIGADERRRRDLSNNSEGGKSRHWAMSQLGKGRPSIPPSDKFLKREPSILELVHAHMGSSDGIVMGRDPAASLGLKRRTHSGSLAYTDPNRRLRSATLTSIPAEGESDEDYKKRQKPSEARHLRSHTSADPRGSTIAKFDKLHTLPDQPESITTSSDVEDHSMDSDDESLIGTISLAQIQLRNSGALHRSHVLRSTVGVDHLLPDDEEESRQNARKLTGISPAMRRDFPARVLQFGHYEHEHQSSSSADTIPTEDGSSATGADTVTPVNMPTPSEARLCDTCGTSTAASVLTLMEPCCHLACFDCLNAVLNTVCSNGPGGNPGRSRCSAFGCGQEIVGIVPYLLSTQPIRQQVDRLEDKETQLRLAIDALPDENEQTVVVRMDNVAWDVTPDTVAAFLPEDTLADDLIQNVHIMIDRNDGKAKDYLFFECRDRHAATKVLRTKQNSILGNPPRARPVTLTLSSHAALIAELRPSGPKELENLMLLCRSIDGGPEQMASEIPMGLQTPQQTPVRRQAELAVAASPAQTGRFLKSPLAPYHSLMSLLSKIASKDEDKTGRGKSSMIYWDLFACAAGAVTVLAKRSLAARRAILPLTPPGSTLTLSPMGVPFRQQQPNEIDAQDGRSRSDSQAFRNSIDAKIKEKLERDRARQASIGPTATPRALGRTKTEQPSTPAFSRGALTSPASRIQEEALTHVLIAAFEKTVLAGNKTDRRFTYLDKMTEYMKGIVKTELARLRI